jgi:hypothetical protein
MRRLITINFETLLNRMLPYHKRQPKRLLLFSWPFTELTALFTAFKIWRSDVFYRVNVTGQVISLQTYLNRVIEGANDEITIENFNDWGVWVQLSTEEGESYMIAEYCEAAARGEFTPLTDVDFYVYVPVTVNTNDVARVVNQYKLAGKRYLIITINED